MRSSLVLTLTFCSLFTAVALAEPIKRQDGIPNQFLTPKLIAAGWDSPSPEGLLENLQTIEALPFDGVRISISVPMPEGGTADFYRMFQPEKWQQEWFRPAVETLQKARSEKLTDNLLSVGAGATIDWFDDDAWVGVVERFRIAAWVAKQGGLRGLLFNPEVGIRLPAFSYNRQLERERYSFADYSAKIRERGRAVMKAMASEYPDMVFLCMFLNGGQAYSPFYQRGGLNRTADWYMENGELRPAGPSGPLEVQQQLAPLERIEGGSYNLLPAFLNGLLDAVPPEMRIVDGLEQTYVATERPAFLRWAHNVHSAALPLVAPENRAKYRSQVEVGFGIYLDPYVNPPGSRYFIDAERRGESRVNRLERAVQHALETTDGYVWLWGEKHRWWPTPMKRVLPETWEEVAPGITQALGDARDPAQKIAREYRKAAAQFATLPDGKAENLVANGGFDTDDLTLWKTVSTRSIFRHDGSTGAQQPGALHLPGAPASGAEIEIEVPKGRGMFGIRAKVRTANAKASIRVRWKRDDNAFLLTSSDAIRLTPSGKTDAAEWQTLEAVVSPPASQNRLVLQCLHHGGESAESASWFDDIEIYRLNP